MKADMVYFATIDYMIIINSKDTPGIEEGILMHAQQCLEKLLKALLKCRCGLIVSSHSLLYLTTDLTEFDELWDRFEYTLKLLDSVYFEDVFELYKFPTFEHWEYEKIVRDFVALADKLFEMLNTDRVSEINL